MTPEDLHDYLLDNEHYHPGRPGRFHPQSDDHGIYPLWLFGEMRLGQILDACERRTPPRRWLRFEGGEMGSRAWHEWHWTRGMKLRRDETYRPRGRRHIPHSVRLAVYERDGWKCLHCDTPDHLSLDHIHPYSLGGEDTIENLQTLCRPCNSRKGARI